MDELEHKLRSALTEMAEGVPPSHHAWAEQERRLAMKSRRSRVRPALMAAVAAAVVALIAVPVVILNSRNAPVEMGAEPPLITGDSGPPTTQFPNGQTAKIPYRPTNGETLSAGPMVVGSAGTRENNVYVYTYAVLSAKGQSLCFATNADGNEINGPEQVEYGAPSCTPIAKPKSGFSWGMRQAPVSTNAGGTYVYVMSRPADKLMARDVNERLIVSQQKALGDEFTLFVTYMDSQPPAKAWTVKDATGADLQHGP
jgi:hypothetical protein